MAIRNVRRPWRPPTLRDIAKVTGASLATVSRSIASATSRAEGPRPRAADSIVATARSLGYTLDAEPGRRLVVFTSDIGRTGYWETLSGICDAAREENVEVSIHVVSGAPETRRSTLASALKGRIDGAVLLEFDSPSEEIIEHLPRDLPFAIAGGYPGENDSIPRAWIDDYEGAKMATEHLANLGHELIGFVGIPAAGHPDPRLRGWRDVLETRSLTVLPQLGTGWSAETGRRAAAHAAHTGLSAVLCGNDDLAFGVLAGLSDIGVRVPDQISVVGMDDHPLAACSVPSLTTVRLDFARAGEIATHLALGDESGADSGTAVMIPPELIVRGSTAAPAR